MAGTGWINRDGNDSGFQKTLNTIKGPIQKLFRLGQEIDDLIVKNKLGIGLHEANLRRANITDEESVYLASNYDINYSNNKLIGFFQKDYPAQRENLRKVANSREISKFLDIISDEAIVYDEKNFFAEPNTETFQDLSEDIRDQVMEDLLDNYRFIYTNVFDFKESTVAWRFFRQYLIDGALAFELVFNEKGNRIIKAIPLDPAFMQMNFTIVNGIRTKVWVLYPEDTSMRRELPDTHVVYISHAKDMISSELSYTQSLIRSYNLYRTVENTSIIWTIMNSSLRLKTIVPVAGGRAKNEQQIGEIIAKFREEITVMDDSGEVFIDGKPNLLLFKNYALASKNGQQTTIESMKFEGYDMANSDIIKYWRDKLWEDSQIPFVRLQRDSSPTINLSAEGFEREEIKFGKMINRLRSDFQEIISKPLWIQMCLDYPEFLEDEYFKSKISIKFNSENRFEELRQRLKLKANLEDVQTILGIQDPSGEGSFFDFDLIMETYGGFSPDFLKKNEELKKAKKEAGEKNEGDAGGDTGGTADTGGGDFDFGGGDTGGGTEPPPTDTGGETPPAEPPADSGATETPPAGDEGF
jgi:hypothetical protein